MLLRSINENEVFEKTFHICAWFGLGAVIMDIIATGVPADIRDRKYELTPLMLACRRGKLMAVIELMKSAIDVNAENSDGYDALYEAVSNSRHETISTLVRNGKINMNKPYSREQERTPLMIAAENKDAEAVRQLLESDAISVNDQDAQGFSALALACRKDDEYSVQNLLNQQGIDINVQNAVGASCLHIAADLEHINIARILLAHGIDHALKDTEGGACAIARAVDTGNLTLVKEFVSHGVSISCIDEQGRGLLHAAAINARSTMIPYLVELGLDPNVADTQGRTPLHDAARLDDPNTAQTLLEHAANPSVRDSYGRLPSTVAWENGCIKVLDLLEDALRDLHQGQYVPLSREIDKLPLWAMVKLGYSSQVEQLILEKSKEGLGANRIDTYTGNTPLHYAVSLADDTSIIQTLLRHQIVDINQSNRTGRTPLQLAVLDGRVLNCSLLLTHGANTEIKDLWGSDSLHIACAKKRWEIAMLLIESGADIASCHVSPTSLLFTAVEFGKPEAVKILIEGGADVGSKNLYGQSPLQVAVKESNKSGHSDAYDEIMQMLRQNKSVYNRPELPKHVSAPTAFPQPDMAEDQDDVPALPTISVRKTPLEEREDYRIKKRVTF